jgi:hypothetical protein
MVIIDMVIIVIIIVNVIMIRTLLWVIVLNDPSILCTMLL